MQLPGFDLTVIAKEFRLTQTVIKWKANYDPTKEWDWLPPIWQISELTPFQNVHYIQWADHKGQNVEYVIHIPRV